MLEKIMDNEMFLRRGRGRAQKLQKMNDIFNKTCGKKGSEAGVPPLLSTMNVVVVECSPRRMAEASVKSIVAVFSTVVVGVGTKSSS